MNIYLKLLKKGVYQKIISFLIRTYLDFTLKNKSWKCTVFPTERDKFCQKKKVRSCPMVLKMFNNKLKNISFFLITCFILCIVLQRTKREQHLKITKYFVLNNSNFLCVLKNVKKLFFTRKQ